jgi:uncharacterized protein (DUF2249 family)
MTFKTVTVDVREDIRSGREPFSKIMNAAAALQQDERLLLIAPFEPLPLFRVMENKGFAHDGHATPAGDWEVLFTRRPATQPKETARPIASADSHIPAASEQEQFVDLDARGLEPPQPMVKILETLAALPAGAELRARTDRRPLHLYAQLEARGFASSTEEQPDGTFLTHIRLQ